MAACATALAVSAGLVLTAAYQGRFVSPQTPPLMVVNGELGSGGPVSKATEGFDEVGVLATEVTFSEAMAIRGVKDWRELLPPPSPVRAGGASERRPLAALLDGRVMNDAHTAQGVAPSGPSGKSRRDGVDRFGSAPASARSSTATPTATHSVGRGGSPTPEMEANRADARKSPTFNGRPLRKVRTMTMKVTAYSPDARSCGKFADGITASGYSVWTNGMKLVAADTELLPFGTVVSVPGYDAGRPVPVLDRGGKIKGQRLDVLYPTHEIAREWGVQEVDVTVWEYAD